MKKVLKILWKIIKVYLTCDIAFLAWLGAGDMLYWTKKTGSIIDGAGNALNSGIARHKNWFKN